MFLHLPYHPANPSSKSIQKLWHDVVATLKGQTPLHCLTNQQGYDIPIERLAIAWHSLPNLGNLLSYRKLENCTGLKVLSFIKTWDKYAPIFLSRGQMSLVPCPLLKKLLWFCIVNDSLNLWEGNLVKRVLFSRERPSLLSLFWIPFSFY